MECAALLERDPCLCERKRLAGEDAARDLVRMLRRRSKADVMLRTSVSCTAEARAAIRPEVTITLLPNMTWSVRDPNLVPEQLMRVDRRTHKFPLQPAAAHPLEYMRFRVMISLL